jgi:hypothetical protein
LKTSHLATLLATKIVAQCVVALRNVIKTSTLSIMLKFFFKKSYNPIRMSDVMITIFFNFLRKNGVFLKNQWDEQFLHDLAVF